MNTTNLLMLARELRDDSPHGFTLQEYRALVRERLGLPLARRAALDVLRTPALGLTEADELFTGGAPSVPSAPPRPGCFVVFDVETIGSDRHSAQIVQLAALRIEDWVPAPPFNAFVSGRTLDELTQAITGLTQADLDGGRPIEEVLEDFLTYARGWPLAGHNVVTFDLPILEREAQDAGLGVPNGGLDTLALSEILLPLRDSYRLEDLMEAFEGDVHERAHQADADVAANYRLLLELQRAWGTLAPLDAAGLHATGFPELALLPPREPLELPDDWLDRSARPVRQAVGTTGQVAPPARDVFGPGGRLSQLFTTYEPRPTQVQMAQLVETLLTGGGRGLIEAPTGTGKTKGYLVPAAAVATTSGGPLVVVSTHTKALQAQALEEVQELNAMGIPFRASIFKGVRNYLCPLKLREVLGSLEDLGAPERRFVAYLLRWVQTGHGDLEAVHGWWSAFRAARDLTHQVRTDSSLCSPDCPFHDRCAFQDRNAGLRDAHVVIANHAATFTALPVPGEDDRPQAIVFDEAHNLEDAARSAYTVELDASELRAALAELARPGGGYLAWLERRHPNLREELTELRATLRRAREALPRLEAAMHRWAIEADRQGKEAYGWNFEVTAHALSLPAWPPLHAHVQGLRATLRQLAQDLRRLPVTPRGKAIASRLDEGDPARPPGLVQVLAQLLDAPGREPGDRALVITAAEGQWTLEDVPLDLRPHLEAFYGGKHALVFTSATLRLKRAFTHMRRVLALDEDPAVQELALDPVLPYHHARLLLPWHLPPPSRAFEDAFVRAYADELANALRVTDGRSLALFAARDRMNRTYLRVSGQLDGQLGVLAQGRGPREQLVRTFRQDVRSSLFGLRSMMEGVDVPGESLTAVHLEKIPFPVVRATERALQRHYEDTGRNWWEEYYLPRGIIPFVQAFGRLIRGQGDRGAFVVWDRRVSGAFYWDDFLDSLPVTPKQLDEMVITPTDRLDFFRQIAEATGREPDPALIATLTQSPAEELLATYRGRDTYTDDDLRAVLRGLWGHDDFRPGQLDTIRDQLAGKDVMLILPTGGGKSLTFQLPALLSPGLTVVISPLISLMQDQHGDLLRRGVLSAAALHGGLSQNDQQDILRAVGRGEHRLLYLSPERLFASQELRAALPTLNLTRVVVDEAHCVSMWGHGFRPEYLLVREVLDDLQLTVPITAVTATATPDVERDILRALGIPGAPVRRSSVTRRDLNLRAVRAGSRDNRLTQLAELARTTPTPALIYCATVKDVRALYALLTGMNLRAGQYHAQLTPYEREEVQEGFLNDDLDLLVATKAFGMGINKPNIRHVIHYQLPDALESYVQEVGRAGRDGAGAQGTLLHTTRDQGLQQLFIDRAFPDLELIARVHRWITGQDGPPFAGHVRLREDAQTLALEERDLQMALHALHSGGVIARLRSLPDRVQVRARRPLDTLGPVAQHVLSTFTPDPDTAGAHDGSLLTQPNPREAYRELLSDPHLRVRTLSRALEITVHGTPPDWRPYVEQYLQTAQRRLQRLVHYAQTRACRHQTISQHFGEHSETCTAHCDNCDQTLALTSPQQSINLRALLGTRRTLRQIVKYCEEAGAPVGRVKVSMIARGVARQGQSTLHPLYLRCPAYGRLETLSERELLQELEHMLNEGHVHTRAVDGVGAVVVMA